MAKSALIISVDYSRKSAKIGLFTGASSIGDSVVANCAKNWPDGSFFGM